MKPGDRVIWLTSSGRSFPSGWRVPQVGGVIIGIGRHRLEVRVQLGGKEKIGNINPDNVIYTEEISDA